MNSGDNITVDIHDTSAGLQVIIHDQTNHQSGSMTASVANGFAQINFDPAATTCTQTPYAFHPMYADLERAYPGAMGSPLLQRCLLG